MTRDEAIKIFHSVTYPDDGASAGLSTSSKFAADRRWSEKAVDGFVRLGMLKLDEPKSAWESFMHEMKRHGYCARSVAISDMAGALDRANLQITEK